MRDPQLIILAIASCALINSVLYRVKTVGNSLSPVTMA